MFGLGPLEILVIAAIAVMIYGKRLPEVGQTFGRTVGQLRKQWQAMSREFEMAANLDGQAAQRRVSPPAGRRFDNEGGPTVSAPKFDPPPGGDA
jgi:sec-independent protein translocase protein TatA